MEPHAAQPRPYDASYPDMPDRQCFQRADTSVGAAGGYPLGHLMRLGGTLAPLVIGELVKDPDKRWRWIRLCSLLLAGVSEIAWAQREHQRREERNSHRAR